MKDWKIQIPDGFSETGYKEEIQYEDYEHMGEIWFVGQLAAV